MTPPPGWYPDPHAPHQERWWDGTAWTEHRRTPGAPPPPAEGASRPAKAIALVTAGVVLVAAIVVGALVLRGGDGEDTSTAVDTPPTAADGPPAAPASGTPPSPLASRPADASPSGDPDRVVDELNGITLPLPTGWVRPEYVADHSVVMSTDGTYDCPAGAGLCRHGYVTTHTADAGTPEDLAREDIPDAADAAYEEDLVGERPFGGIESHRVVASGPLTVAGRAGYFVRWRVTTADGPGGYVESLAFPSSTGSGAPVVVRLVLDAGPDGPPLSEMDTITRGIRPGEE
ncbi:DUF2510 domain-containing protein [Streptomyces sp. NPDC026672]|uniref:DUF2510 domain-containing protein n=1 Tax=unclassified Streptomyces TaxID=2593676 RepID=UPI003411664C